jgi:hypothetical protein
MLSAPVSSPDRLLDNKIVLRSTLSLLPIVRIFLTV